MDTNFNSRFAGVRTQDYGSRYDRTDQEGIESSYRMSSQIRKDALEEKDFNDRMASSKLYSDAIESISSGVDSPALAAYKYADTMANITALVKGDRMDEAYDLVRGLKDTVDNNLRFFIDASSTVPNQGNVFETAVNAGASLMSRYAFYDTNVTMANGETTTVGSLFRDSDTYKRFRRSRVIDSRFSTSFANDYSSTDDEFKRTIFNRIVDPVIAEEKRVGMDSGKNRTLNRYVTLADTLSRNWDTWIGVLGERGMDLAVNSALEGASDGTCIDTMNNIVSWVGGQRSAKSDEDSYDLVRKAVDQFSRLTTAVNTKIKTQDGSEFSQVSTPTDKERRFYSKIMSFVLDGSPVDFDDVNVRDRMEKLARVAQTAETRGIQFLVDGNELGPVSMRRAVNEYVHSKDGSDNLITRTENLFNVCDQLIKPMSMSVKVGPNGVQQVETSGIQALDGAISKMSADLSRIGFSRLASGIREDMALRDSLSSAELLDAWSRTLSVTAGLSDDTSKVLSSKLAKTLSSPEGGFRPANVKQVITDLAVSDDTPQNVKSELLKWMHAQGSTATIMERFKAPYMQMLTDTTIGNGLSAEMAEGEWARLLTSVGDYLDDGVDPSGAMNTLMSMYPFYNATGNMVLSNGAVLTRDEFKVAVNSRNDRVSGKGKNIIRNIELTPDLIDSAVPEITFSGTPVDLRTVKINGIDGVIGGFNAGAWSDERVRPAILLQQRKLKAIFDSQMKANSEAAAYARRRYQKQSGDTYNEDDR